MLQALGPLLVALTPNTFIAPAVTTPVRPRAAVFLEVVQDDLIAKRKNAERLALLAEQAALEAEQLELKAKELKAQLPVVEPPPAPPPVPPPPMSPSRIAPVNSLIASNNSLSAIGYYILI